MWKRKTKAEVVVIDYKPTVIPPTLKAGDILHIAVGIENMGDGQPPYIPGPEDLAQVEEVWARVVPEGVIVLATHYGERPQILQVEANDGDTFDQMYSRDPE